MQPTQLAEIVDPSASCGQEFRVLAHVLRQCLGNLALRIDHIGSTSVAGLAAKDVIDIQVTVAELAVDQLAPALSRAGFEYRPDTFSDHRPPGSHGPDSDWAKLYFRQGAGMRPAHVHVRVLGRPNQRYALLFRDYLRARPEVAAAYAELKRRLAALGLSRPVYADTKDPACDLIMSGAEEWAARVSWSMGLPDA
jgi:GrpB-like predicted nucleotidyltransferase (UPF0157 family)